LYRLDKNSIRTRPVTAIFKGMFDYLKEQGLDVSIENGDEYDEELTVRLLRDMDGVIFSSNGPMSRGVMERLPRLKFVMRFGIGLNSIDLTAATELKKIVCYTPGYCSEEVGIHAVALALSSLRNVTYYDRLVRGGAWPRGNGPLPERPRSMTVGTFGLGLSARVFARAMGQGLGARLIACDPYALREDAEKLNVELVSFEELLERSDLISIHAPLNRETYHAFNAEAFGKMKTNAILVNVSRGPVVDTDALVGALKSGRIAKAALDVFEVEPLADDSPLRGFENVVLTPHSAYYGRESVEDANFLIGRITAAVFNKKLLYKKHLANPEVLALLPDYTLTDGPVE